MAKSKQAAECEKCGGAGFLPDRCAECNAAFDPRLMLGEPRGLPCGHSMNDLIEGEECECAVIGTRGDIVTPDGRLLVAEYTIKDYRAAIRSLWLPIVARKKLNGAEMRFIQMLWDRGDPIEVIVQAIKAIDERRRLSNLVVHSLGIIRSDIEAIKIRRSRMNVGRGQRGRGVGGAEAWREEYAESLEELAEGVGNPEIAAQYRELKRDMPGLGFEAVTARFRGIRWWAVWANGSW